MAKSSNSSQSTVKKVKKTSATITSSGISNSELDNTTLLYSKQNYLMIVAGVVLVIIGFFLMSGGTMPDENTWDATKIYSFRRITLAPIVVLLGLGVVGYALFFNTAADKEELESYKPEEFPDSEEI